MDLTMMDKIFARLLVLLINILMNTLNAHQIFHLSFMSF